MKHVKIFIFCAVIVWLCFSKSFSFAETPNVEGMVLFDGQVLTKLDHIDFWFRNNNANTVVSPKVVYEG